MCTLSEADAGMRPSLTSPRTSILLDEKRILVLDERLSAQQARTLFLVAEQMLGELREVEWLSSRPGCRVHFTVLTGVYVINRPEATIELRTTLGGVVAVHRSGQVEHRKRLQRSASSLLRSLTSRKLNRSADVSHVI